VATRPILRPGATIACVAPASPSFDPPLIADGVAALERLGYTVIPPADRRDGHLAGSAGERAAELESAFADPAVDAVMCLRGGYGSGQLLPLIDVERIAAACKAFIGMSDVTHLLVPLADAGAPCLWGPMLQKHATASGYTVRAFQEALSGGPYVIGAAPDSPPTAIVPGQTSAPLTGGTTSILCATLGTPWELRTDGRLLLLEEVDEEPYRIDRLLTQLGQAGKLAAAAGFVVSEHVACEPRRPERSQTLEQVLRRHLEPLGRPCLYGLPLGHGEHLATVPFGVPIELDADEGLLRCPPVADPQGLG
jgi:muramoyltetrapeptide carboxypeptidase